MSVPDPHNIERAAELCICNGDFCNRDCTVCFSPTWEGFACVKHLHATMIGAGNVPVSLPPNLRSLPNPKLPPRNDVAERCIDWLEEQGIPLEPWQAQMLRTMLPADGSKPKPVVLRGRQY